MTRHRAINAALFVAICGLFVLGAALDGPSEHQAQVDQAADMQSAIKSDATSARFTRAAATICGNATYTLDATGALHCHKRKVRGPGVVLTRMDMPGVQQ